MQESWTFDFYLISFSPESWESLIQTKQLELGIFLSYYYKGQGAVVEKVRLKEEPKQDTGDSGTLILAFQLIYFNACLAIHETQEEEMKITFQLDRTKKTLKLVGAFWPSRDPDEI